MPVHFAGLRADTIARMQLNYVSSLGLEQTLALDDMEHLATGMTMPGNAYTGVESNDVHTDDAGVGRLAKHPSRDLACEATHVLRGIAV